VLAGDLFSDPSANKRGASGDVRSVWSAFAAQFRWVVGVAGNHDTFGTPRERERFLQHPGVHLLDTEVRELDGLALGGVSGIIGRVEKPGRREEADQLEHIRKVLRREPEVLVLHEGPDFPAEALRGSAPIREAVSARKGLLIVCGHCHWEVPLVTLEGGAQVLNVDARAVLLTRAPA
jgi:Icc-related predicted phosphoesterase